MNVLIVLARQAYEDQQFGRAAELYEKCLKIAESLGDDDLITLFRFLTFDSLRKAGRLKQAIAAVLPIFQQVPLKGDVSAISHIYARYLYTAISLPVSLEAIENVGSEAENFLRNNCWDLRHMLYCSYSELYRLRCMYEKALNIGQEGWTIWRNTGHRFSSDDHLRELIKICLILRKVELAREYFEIWERQENEIPSDREKWFCARQADFARFEGRLDESLRWARRAVRANIDQQKSLVRTLLTMGDCKEARKETLRLLKGRGFNSEKGHMRYDTRLLIADYHLACARQAAEMTPADDEYGQHFPPPARIANPANTRRELCLAWSAYSSALRTGEQIDKLLVCTKRQNEIAQRIRRLQDIEDLT